VKLAYSTNAYTRTDLSTALRRIADLGFDGAEILCDRPHWFPGEVSAADADAVAELLDALGLKVSNLNANTANGFFDPAPPENVFEPALTHPDPERRRWRERYTIEAVKLARRIGARCVSVTSGRPTSDCTPERALEFFVDSLKRICDAAATHDVNIGIEYEPGLLVEYADELAEVILRVDSPRLGANLDIGHSFVAREDPAATVNTLAGRIWNVHVEDIKARKHFHLVPGDGDLPFTEYFDALRRVGYAGFLTVELYNFPSRPDEVGSRSLQFLRRLLPAT
jgi:sugar phosphate isomerase/epimerase